MEEIDESTVQLSSSSLFSKAAFSERYEIKALIGQGGMGMVFRAADLELARDVAIKVLLFAGASDEALQQRFLREAKALALLSHRNVVRIFSSGLNKQGNPYHVMEYLDGESLALEMKEGPLSPGKFFDVFQQICDGLGHAHSYKIAHRDLKPSNIMHIKDAEGKDIYKLIDFGIARLEAESSGATKTLTRTDAVLGSPVYMSPEQCRGQHGGPLSDIYSLGCIMYECIAGHPPFYGETALETMYKHMTENSARLDLLAKSAYSKQLAHVVDKCLEKDPENRWQSAAQIRDELKRIGGAAQIDSLDIFKPKSVKQDKRRNWFLFLLAFIGLFITGGAGVAIWQSQQHAASDSLGIKLVSEQEKLEKEIDRRQLNFARKDPFTEITRESDKQQYLNILISLLRLELRSTRTKDFVNAEKLSTQALEFWETLEDKSTRKRVLCLAMRAKARWKQDKIDISRKDLKEALQLAQKSELGIGVINDLMIAKTELEIKARNIRQAYLSFSSGADAFLATDGDSAGWFMPKLDSMFEGDNRCRMIGTLAHQLRDYVPDSTAEATKVVELANKIVRVMIKTNMMKQEANMTSKYAKTIAEKFGCGKTLVNEANALLESSLKPGQKFIDVGINLGDN